MVKYIDYYCSVPYTAYVWTVRRWTGVDPNAQNAEGALQEMALLIDSALHDTLTNSRRVNAARNARVSSTEAKAPTQDAVG